MGVVSAPRLRHLHQPGARPVFRDEWLRYAHECSDPPPLDAPLRAKDTPGRASGKASGMEESPALSPDGNARRPAVAPDGSALYYTAPLQNLNGLMDYEPPCFLVLGRELDLRGRRRR